MSGSGTRALDAATARRIAAAFAPPRRIGNRWHRDYARIKLATDPLYPGVVDALRGSDAPVLDLGCGIGLLAHALRAAGLAMPYRGVDHDAPKLGIASRAAGRAGLADVDFSVVDLARGLPAHAGSIALLDVLQYLDADAQARLLDAAIAMLSPGARLVIRTGLDDEGVRARRSARRDRFAHWIGWMRSAPRSYPREDALRARLARAGLAARFEPLGRRTLNNWLVVAQR